MGATFSRVKSWINGETLAHTDLNAEFDNILTNLTPAGVDDASTNVAAMRTTSDPYAAATEVLATSLQGEIQQLRYILAQVTGETYWYVDPDTTVAALNTATANLPAQTASAATKVPLSLSTSILNQTWTAVQPQGCSNLSISASVGSKALTVALKGLDGNDPSATNPVEIVFRSATLTTSTPVRRQITAATSVVLSSGSTLGFTAAEAGRIYVWAIDNAGTVVLGLSRTADIFPEYNVASTTAEGGAGAADSASVMYSTEAQTSKAIRCIGFIEITTGAVAGEWDNAPTLVQVMGPGVKRTGDIVQKQITHFTEVATGTTILPGDNSIPQNTEGNEYMTLAITPTSAVNKLFIESNGFWATNEATAVLSMACALFQDTTVNALAAIGAAGPAQNRPCSMYMSHYMTAGTTSSTTFKVRAGAGAAGTTTFNGSNTTRLFGAINKSSLSVTEIFA